MQFLVHGMKYHTRAAALEHKIPSPEGKSLLALNHASKQKPLSSSNRVTRGSTIAVVSRTEWVRPRD